MDNIINTMDNIINTMDNIINTMDNILNTMDNIINTMDNIIDIKGYGDIMKFFLVTGLVTRFLKNLFRKTKGNNLNLKLC